MSEPIDREQVIEALTEQIARLQDEWADRENRLCEQLAAHEAEIAQLRQKNAEYLSWVEKGHTGCGACAEDQCCPPEECARHKKNEVRWAEREAALRATIQAEERVKLVKWGQHRAWCAYTADPEDGACTCGFTKAVLVTPLAPPEATR